MNADRPKSGVLGAGAKPAEPRRNLARYLTILLIVLTLGSVWALVRRAPSPKPTAESISTPAPNGFRLKKQSASPAPVPARPEGETPAPVEATVRETPAASNSGAALANPIQAVPRGPEPTPQTREMVKSLTQIDFSRGALTPEQASQWKQGLQQLVQQGAATVPAIREFLERNQDLRFDAVNGGDLTGYPSLRAGLFDALQQIGGPEALELSLQTLRTTTDPLEIALLARNMEQQAPGQYRQEALNAARVALAQAAQGQLNVGDVAPLFQLFQTYGDAGLLAELQSTLPRWNYYATMALAGLPGGEGIPTLIREVQDPGAASSSMRDLALQMLAQRAAQYPEAGTALLEQARLNQISDQTWRQIGWVLGGDQYQFGSAYFDNTLPPPSGGGVRTYHIESGNQNFYTTPNSANWSADQINQRRILIEQLLGVTSNPAAVQALQTARTALPGG